MVVVCRLTFSIKREIRQFYVVAVQRRQRNVPKSVLHVQNCCFANLNLLLQFHVLVGVAFVATKTRYPKLVQNQIIVKKSNISFSEMLKNK